ncbi:hypothetical protein SAMN05444279_13223 [Ruegeria intermedia]|uniref:Uncharacterized protein n=1 Tax=Ruegeria intermedia TaxID=996115 RepID=A0A1M5B4U1_9RHOB|nr:hypothetical protein [Ruegeria intermedia]SHF37458.1 hypothetical protein SAMN05444279_13223 [Ruegeria intermedia]
MGTKDISRGRFLWLGIAAAILLMTTATVWLRFFFQAPPVVFVSVRSNHIEYQVKRPALARLAIVDGTWVGPETDCTRVTLSRGRAYTLLLMPAAGAQVEYLSLPTDILITVTPNEGDGVRVLNSSLGMGCDIKDTVSVLIAEEDFARNQPFPVFGPVEIGSDTSRTEPPRHTFRWQLTPERIVETIPVRFVQGGQARLFGRLDWRGQLYPVIDGDFPIPRGSRIEFASDDVSGSIVRAADEPIFDIQFTVEATAMRVFRPGKTQQHETFATGLMARAFSDPILSVIFLVLGISGFLLSILSYVHGVWTNRGDDA